MKQKRNVLIAIVFLLVYAGSYCCVRLLKMLVHQEVAFVNTTNITKGGRAICYFIHHDIGHGSFTDEDNYNMIKSPSTATRIGKCLYYPLVKLEVAYWQRTQPREIYETICSQ